MIKQIVNEILPEYSNQQVTNSRYKFSSALILKFLWLFSCVFLIYFLEIENNKNFHQAAVILAAGFSVYIFVPLQYRKLFLIALGLVLEIYLIGIKLGTGVFLLILYFTFLTYVKNKTLRTVLVLISTVLCLLIFSKIIIIPFLRNVLMFGALFLMLRYIYLLYELNYFKKPPLFIERLGYLFLIPNACFPLFPVLDPKEHINLFYQVPNSESLNHSLHNITVGIIHVLIYRIIYFYFSPSSYEIHDFWSWLRFILSSYSLIFRLSGLFYLAVGFLELFGFKFRPVFAHVYFAKGFSDLWRRINLYWREFMMRVFYYPLMFKFKKYNQKAVIFFGINFMFFVTWFLHSWQWFWIKGTYYFYPADMLFWAILGIIISITSVRAYSAFSQNAASSVKTDSLFLDTAKIVLMFFIMSVLWSLWTSSSITEFVYIEKFMLRGRLPDYFFFLAGLILFIFLAAFVRYSYLRKNRFNFMFTEFKPLYGIGFCLLVYGTLQFLKTRDFNEEVSNFLSSNVNQNDKAMLERGYYDQILNNDDKSIELINIGGKFTKWNIDNRAYRRTKNELIKEFIPNFKTVFKGDTLYTNSFGLRDKEYNVAKDVNTVRMAFLGGSYVMGSGVSNEENFAALLEKKLSQASYCKIEILNFGAGGYHLIQNVFVAENKLKKFNSDFLVYFIHSSDRNRCLDDFVNLSQKDSNLTYSFLKEIKIKAGIKKGMCRLEIYNRLKPYINEIMIWGYKKIYKAAKENNTIPVIVYLPANASLKEDKDREFCLQEASGRGFHIIDLTGVYKGYNPRDIQLSSWDAHPNEKGHKLISDLLFEKMQKDKQFFTFMK